MRSEDAYFDTLSTEELWKRYCGFLDLSVPEFMRIQRTLLTEHLGIVSNGALGRRILGPHPPSSIEEFRRTVPFTAYDDYEPELSQKRESALAAPVEVWCHSSARGGRFKWVPHSSELMEKTVRHGVGLFNLSAASRRGQITVGPGMKMLVTIPLAPYTSGTIFAALQRGFTFQSIPPLDSVADLPFQEQIARAFQTALRDGFDVGGAMASVLVRMGQQISGQAQGSRGAAAALLHPRVLFRLLRGYLRSRAQGRPIYPKDIWSPRGIMTGGVDTSIYREEIQKYWGITPFDVYAATETMFLAMQSWTKRHMTFLPDSVFLEFIPWEASGGGTTPGAAPSGNTASRAGTASTRGTLLLDELEAGGLYEIVITQFHGMPLLRYRLGDIIRVVDVRDEAAGIGLPQVEVRRKVGELINLGGLCNLDERTLWTALAAAGLSYTEWACLKEYDHSQTFLRLVIELKEPCGAAEVSRRLDEQLRAVDADYADVNRYLGVNPVRTTVLAGGSFARYTESKVAEGAVLSHFKPRHVNPPADVMERLLGVGKIEDMER